MHACDNTDDLGHDVTLVILARINRDAFANRIFPREILFRQSLIYDYDPWRIRCVAVVEGAAAQERDFQGSKIISGDDFEIGARHLPGRRLWRSLAYETGLPTTHQRGIGADACALHTGKHPHSVEESFRKYHDLFAAGVRLER